MTARGGIPVTFISASDDTDAALAAVRHGIEQVGRTWTRRRALRTICTRRGTSSDRDLWNAERRAMDGSQWFVLLASPGAAESDWIGREIEYWLEVKGVDTLLPVLAAGTWAWDRQESDFRWDQPTSVTAVPPALRGVFTEEPRHLDMSWVGDDTELTMDNPRFAEQMAELAAPMHGVTTEDLAGEDVRQRRRIQRVVRTAAGVLTVLLVAAVVATLLALTAQRAADTQRKAADEQAALADERTRAAVGRRLADEATSARSLSLDVRLLLAAQAYELGVSPQSEVALFELLRNPERSTPPPLLGDSVGVVNDFEQLTGRLLGDGGMSFLDGAAAVVTTAEPMLPVGTTPRTILRYAGPDWLSNELTMPDGALVLAVGADGRLLLVSRTAQDPPLADEGDAVTSCGFIRPGDPCEMVVLDIESGSEQMLPIEAFVESSEPSVPGRARPMVRHRFSPDADYLLTHDRERDGLAIIATSGGRLQRVDARDGVSDFGLIDASRAWMLSGTTLSFIELATGGVSREVDLAGVALPTAAAIGADAEFAVFNSIPSGLVVMDLRTEAVVAVTDVGLLSEEIAIDADSRWVAVSGEGTTRLMDVATLRTVGRFDHVFYGKGLDTGAELAFDDRSSYLLIRPTNPPYTAIVYVVSTRPDEWFRLACETAGRSLTSVEWAEHVGLAEFEPACV